MFSSRSGFSCLLSDGDTTTGTPNQTLSLGDRDSSDSWFGLQWSLVFSPNLLTPQSTLGWPYSLFLPCVLHSGSSWPRGLMAFSSYQELPHFLSHAKSLDIYFLLHICFLYLHWCNSKIGLADLLSLFNLYEVYRVRPFLLVATVQSSQLEFMV
jgi:hypothetical protein